MTTAKLHNGDCRDIIAAMESASVDAIVTDPPYEIGFMGKGWDDSGIAYNVALWRECLRVLKPGGHLLSFGGTRTYHRMAAAIEDAGFEIRDSIHWIYGSGFPKSHNVSKSIDRKAGAKREVVATRPLTGNGKTMRSGFHQPDGTGAGNTVMQDVFQITAPATDAARRWEGWGTALKPAHEPIVLARKPLIGTVADNVQTHGTGALNIDATRIATGDRFGGGARGTSGFAAGYDADGWTQGNTLGRWPANVILDEDAAGHEWARYFYCPKANKAERNAGGVANGHPTVKPLALMRYLVRLVTPPGGTVLEPFAGSGTTMAAAILEGFDVIGCEMTDDYLPIIQGRIAWAHEEREREDEEPKSLFGGDAA